MPDDSSPPQRPAGASQLARWDEQQHLPPGVTLSALGVELEKGRTATGLSTDQFLRQHRLYLRTWWRLLFGLLTDKGSAPQPATIVRYAAAAGLDKRQALDLAAQTFASAAPAGRFTALGAELERLHAATGQPIRKFLAERGLTPATWHRLVTGEHAPNRTTVARYAEAVGLDVERAWRLAEQDRSSRALSGAESAAQGRPAEAPEPAADANPITEEPPP